MNQEPLAEDSTRSRYGVTRASNRPLSQPTRCDRQRKDEYRQQTQTGRIGCDFPLQTKEMTRGIWIMLILCTLSKHQVNSELTGDHVCQQEQRYKVNVTKYEIQNKTVRTYVWCIQVPPRCSDYTVKRINVTKIEEKERIRYIDKCCEGYYEMDGKCSPNSCRACQHGTCDVDGICRCDLGYWGTNCEKDCTSDSPSDACPRSCSDCVEDFCDIATGNCTCSPNATRCDLVCAENHSCVKQCKCDDGTRTICDPFTTKCITDNKDYKTAHGNYNNNSDSKLVKNELKLPSGNEKYDFDVTSISNILPLVTRSSGVSIKTKNVDHFVHETIKDTQMKVTIAISTTTTKIKTYDYTTEINEEISTENLTNYTIQTSTQVYPNKEFSKPEAISDEHKISNVKEEEETPLIRDTSIKEGKETSSMQSFASNSSTRSIVIDNHLLMTVIGAALFTVLVVMSAAVFCVLYKLKEKKKKIVTTTKENEEAKIRDSISSVSVTTRSIFHTPLPDPPIFENPAFVTQFESCQTKQPGTFETHIICNMNIPKNNDNQAKAVETTEFFYDHPPSTGSYRATTTLEPPNQESNKHSFDPIYDEIPCNQRIVPLPTPPPSYASTEHATLYMNTK
ncbi:hypothetical protein Trydic_g1430 [Trypoxylus dichotomus]